MPTSPLSSARWRRAVRRDWEAAALEWERLEPSRLYALAAVDPFLIRALAPTPGHRVLDVGCGSGEPALALAPLVLPRGQVVGLDLSAAMLAIARRRAKSRGLANVRFRRGDIARLRVRGRRFDRAVSRFGLMFVEDVPGTLVRIRSALGPGGRAAFAVWGPMGRNPHFAIMRRAVEPLLSESLPDPEKTPHPMRLARAGLLAGLMRAAGFRDVRTEGVRVPFVYLDAEEYVEGRIESLTGPLLHAYRALSARDRSRVRERMRRAVKRHRSGAVLRVPGFAWVVSARR